jgi:manganese/zinc/iron transport system substrate-binding protein
MTKVAAVVALALLTAGCDTDILNETGTSLSSRQVKVVATTTIVADLVEQVGGERVDVQTLMQSGVDPHRYRATPADVEAFADADAVFYNGLGLETRLEHGLGKMGYRALPFAVARGIEPDLLLASPGAGGAYDPHVWFDVELWRRASRQVRDDLISLDRANASVYYDNAERYDRELVELDAWVRRETARIPAGKRVVPAAHPAFAYFARAYSFRVGGSNDRLAGRLFFDALGDAGTPAGTYVGMVRHNVETLVAGLKSGSR